MKYSVCLINQYAGTPDIGMEYRPYYIASELNNLGDDVLVITSNFSHLRNSQFKLKFYQFFKFVKVNNVTFLCLKNFPYKTNGLLRALGIFLFSFQSFIAVTLLKSRDFYIASSTHNLDFLALLSAKLFKKNAKIIYEPHDLWPLTLTSGNFFSPRHPFVKVLQYGEDWLAKNSDYVVSMHPYNNLHLETRGMDSSRFLHIPNGISPTDLNTYQSINVEISRPFQDFRDDHKFLILYAGSISESNGIQAFLDCAKFCSSSHPEIGFVVFGGGNKLDQFLPLFNKNQNIFFGGRVSKAYLASVYKFIDVGYCGFIGSNLYSYGISPNKLWEYMYFSLPILLFVDSPNDPVSEACCGLTISSNSSYDLYQALLNLYDLKKNNKLEVLGHNAHQYVMKYNTYVKLAESFRLLFKKLF